MNLFLFILSPAKRSALASLRQMSKVNPVSRASTHSPVLRSGLRFLDTHGALLVVGLSRNRIEGALRYLIGICFGIVKWHKDLPRSDDLCNAKLYAPHAPARRHHIHRIVRLKVEQLRVP